MKHADKHAIVLGASISGLLAARALADEYGQVTIIERDVFPEVGQPRKGVPQDKHAHGLLDRGRMIVEKFFPGFGDEVQARGGFMMDFGQNTLVFNQGGYVRRVPSDIKGLTASRPLLEGVARTRLLALPNVNAIENCDILGIVIANAKMTGVRVHRRDGDVEEVLPAALVVDSSGRGSQLPTWLKAAGYEIPTVEQVEVGITYTSALYKDHPSLLPDTMAMFVFTDPATKRGAAMIRGEDGWRVTLIGYLGEQAPTDEAGFAAFARSLAAPEPYDIITNATLLSAPKQYKFPANQRRYYEKLTALPKGLIVSGDALCSFNPVYGQGMTIAALEAELLHAAVTESLSDPAAYYFSKVGAIVDSAWAMSVGSDLAFPEVQGIRTGMTRFMNWYFALITRAAQYNGDIARLYHSVINMIAPAEKLMAPNVMLIALWENRPWRRNNTHTSQPSEPKMAKVPQ